MLSRQSRLLRERGSRGRCGCVASCAETARTAGGDSAGGAVSELASTTVHTAKTTRAIVPPPNGRWRRLSSARCVFCRYCRYPLALTSTYCLRLLDKPVADAVHGDDVLWLVRMALELLPESSHQIVDRTRRPEGMVAPDFVEQLIPFDDPPLVCHQVPEHLELECRKRNVAAASAHLVAGEVDLDVAEPIPALGFGHPAPHHHPQTREHV